MKIIYLIRHGQTLFNYLDRVQGVSDTPLTAEGEQRAAALGEKFRKEQLVFDAAYTSDLSRARSTVKLIVEHSANPEIPFEELKDLREINFGMFEGVSDEAMWEPVGRAAGIADLHGDSPDNIKIKALDFVHQLDKTDWAETKDAVTKRVHRALDRLTATEGSRIIAVSHGLFISCILYSLLGEQTTLHPIPNTSVTRLTYDNQEFHVDYIGREENF